MLHRGIHFATRRKLLGVTQREVEIELDVPTGFLGCIERAVKPIDLSLKQWRECYRILEAVAKRKRGQKNEEEVAEPV